MHPNLRSFRALKLRAVEDLEPCDLLFVALPLFDLAAGKDNGETAEEGADGSAFDVLLRGWVVVAVAAHIGVLYHVTTASLSAFEIAGLVVGVGLASATSSINIAHELMHRKRKLDRGIAEALASGPLARPPGQRVRYEEERVERYSTAAAAERLDAVYRELLGRS